MVTASNGLEALEKIEKSIGGDTFELVITDTEMPFMNGRELISAIQKREYNIPAVLMSAKDQSLWARENGVIFFHKKEITQNVTALNELVAEINKKKSAK